MAKQFVRHTGQMQWAGGVPITIPNKTDEVDTGSPHWYISFNSSASVRDYGCQTTALVLGQVEYILILRGDHREGFSEAIEKAAFPQHTRLSACLDYVRANADKLHEYSDKIL